MKKDQRYQEIAASLGRPEPELEAMDLQVRQNAARAPLRRPRRWMAWSGALAAAACLTLYLGLRPSEFRAKGGRESSWAGVRLFRVSDGVRPAPNGVHFRSGDGILISYTNVGPHPFDHLMVFAVGADGRVSWLYPAWQRAEEDPSSIEIASGDGVELRELIHPQWAPGAVAVHALFTHGPLHVREVEAHLGRSFPNASDQSFSFIVDP